MKTFTPLSAAGLAAALLNLGAFLVPQTARAQDPVEVTFTAPAAGQSVTVGTDVLFDAAFTNLTGNSYQVTDATFTSTDPDVNAEVVDGQIAAFFNGDDGSGNNFTLGTGATGVSDIFELDLASTLLQGQTISGTVGFTGYLEDGSGSPTGPSIEVASQSFSVVTASATTAPEPSSVAAFACAGLFAAGLMLRARKRQSAA